MKTKINFIKAILTEIRVKHYIKNIIVFLPLIFSLNLTDGRMVLPSFLMFVSFCLGSSAVYVTNDIADVSKDRLHPEKKLRPIASGIISVRAGILTAFMCLAAGAALGFFVGLVPAVILAGYIAMNVLYSFVFKRYAIFDVFCLMTGFILRIEAGAAAINVPVSQWLLLTVMFLSLYLGFGKRLGEIKRMKAMTDTRAVLSKYSLIFLEQAKGVSMALSIAFYALWAIDPETVSRFGTDKLVWTVPLVAAGLFRYAMLSESSSDGDPTSIILSDISIRILIGISAAVIVTVIYII